MRCARLLQDDCSRRISKLAISLTYGDRQEMPKMREVSTSGQSPLPVLQQGRQIDARHAQTRPKQFIAVAVRANKAGGG